MLARVCAASDGSGFVSLGAPLAGAAGLSAFYQPCTAQVGRGGLGDVVLGERIGVQLRGEKVGRQARDCKALPEFG